MEAEPVVAALAVSLGVAPTAGVVVVAEVERVGYEVEAASPDMAATVAVVAAVAAAVDPGADLVPARK